MVNWVEAFQLMIVLLYDLFVLGVIEMKVFILWATSLNIWQ